MKLPLILSRVAIGFAMAELAFMSGCAPTAVIEPARPSVITRIITVCPKPVEYSSSFYEGLGQEVARLGDTVPHITRFMEDYVAERDGLKNCKTADAMP